MNSPQYIFNKKLLKTRINSFDFSIIPDRETIFKKISNWKYSIENSDLNKTKEEAIQGIFLTTFFNKILGYANIGSGKKVWTLSQEQKVKVDATKADAALGFFTANTSDIRAVVELKDAKTNLDKKQLSRPDKLTPVEQAFSYAYKSGKKCRWVIVSNFKEIRLYSSSDQSQFESFNITELVNEDQFRRFYFLLSAKNLLTSTGKSYLEEIYEVNEEEQQSISRQFYQAYKVTRLKLFEHLKSNNTSINDLLLFEKSQKLMDRFIFVCFCEDTGLLPENIFRKVVDAAKKSFQVTNIKMWQELKNLFLSIDQGNPPMDINRFNGGLFAKDDLLDNLVITDEVFCYLEKIADYDFDSDLNVNILGHIFEQSITDIEEIKAEIKGENIEKAAGKRKKDGIYYTPEYITRYIVHTTIRYWLEDRKKELNEKDLPEIPEDKPSMSSSEKAKRTKAVKRQLEFWYAYKEKLANIKVLDPACGSGAFLNQAFDYLFTEGQKVNEIIAELTGGQVTLLDLDKHILKNNLFGVDLNQESVEITKLSLWLKTANKRDMLTALDDNIKCGNSLIEDKSVAGERAFDWTRQFENIFEQGGFDVIIGNPPWGAKLDNDSKDYLKSHYKHSIEGKIDTYKYFYEKSFQLVKPYSYISMITPNTFLYNVQSKGIRSAILSRFRIMEGIELRKNIFDDAPDVVPAILCLKTGRGKKYSVQAKVAWHNKDVKNLFSNEWMLDQEIPVEVLDNDPDKKLNFRINMGFLKIKEKLEQNPRLWAYFDLKQGTKPYGVKDKKDVELIRKDFNQPGWDKALNGRNIGRYSIRFENDYVHRCDALHSCLSDDILQSEKIYFQRMRKISLFPRIVATYDDGTYHGLYTCSTIFSKETNKEFEIKYILCILNSKLINLWYKYFDTDVEIKLESVKQVPIVKASKKDQDFFASMADKLLMFNQQFYQATDNFIHSLATIYNPKNISDKIKAFYSLDSKSFLNEMVKQKAELSEKTKFELVKVFEEEKAKVIALKSVIGKIDDEINRKLCVLYGLSEAEIKLVKETN